MSYSPINYYTFSIVTINLKARAITRVWKRDYLDWSSFMRHFSWHFCPFSLKKKCLFPFDYFCFKISMSFETNLFWGNLPQRSKFRKLKIYHLEITIFRQLQYFDKTMACRINGYNFGRTNANMLSTVYCKLWPFMIKENRCGQATSTTSVHVH